MLYFTQKESVFFRPEKEKSKYSTAVWQFIHEALQRMNTQETDEKWVDVLTEFLERKPSEPDIILECFHQDIGGDECFIAIFFYDYTENGDRGLNTSNRPIHERDTWLRESVFEGETTGSNYRVLSRQEWIDEDPENRRNALRPLKPPRKLTR